MFQNVLATFALENQSSYVSMVGTFETQLTKSQNTVPGLDNK